MLFFCSQEIKKCEDSSTFYDQFFFKDYITLSKYMLRKRYLKNEFFFGIVF